MFLVTLKPVFLLTVGFALMSQSVSAQLQSLPIYPTAVLQRGSSVAVDYGRDVDPSAGVAQHLGGRATLEAGRASLELGAGLRDAGTDPDLQAAASVGVRLFGGTVSVLALGLQLGVGYLSSGGGTSRAQHLTLPLSVGLAFREIRAGAAGVRPWLAPRVQLNRVVFAEVIVNQPGVGGSGGVNVALPGRVGVHIGVDWSRFSDRRTATVTLFGGSRLTVGAGAYLRFGARAPTG